MPLMSKETEKQHCRGRDHGEQRIAGPSPDIISACPGPTRDPTANKHEDDIDRHQPGAHFGWLIEEGHATRDINHRTKHIRHENRDH